MQVLALLRYWQVPCVPRCWSTCCAESAIQLHYVTLRHARRSSTQLLLSHCQLLIPLRYNSLMQYLRCSDPFAGTLVYIPITFLKLFDGWSKQPCWSIGLIYTMASLPPRLGEPWDPRKSLFHYLLHSFCGLKLAFYLMLGRHTK